MSLEGSCCSGTERLPRCQLSCRIKSNWLATQEITYCVYISFTDFDPCINVSCNYFAVCKAFGPQDARCICVDNCPSYKEPICSSNGTTYDNECMFQREMCHLKANFTLYHPGDCTGNESKFTLDRVTNDNQEYHPLQRLFRLTCNGQANTKWFYLFLECLTRRACAAL